MSKLMFYAKWFSTTWGGLLYQKSYCKEWDRELNRLIDAHWDTARIRYFTITLGGTQVWIANKFYSYGYAYGDKPRNRPSMKTMHRLERLVCHLELQKRKNGYEPN